jgi:glycosyltransferase involved in cell wall biosynthesis
MKSASAAAPSIPPVTVVCTLGRGSMDRHSQHLSAALSPRCPVLVSDIYQRAAEQFAVPAWSRRALRSAWAQRRFVAAARATVGALHLPNHHLARYGPQLKRPYVVTVHDLIRQSDAQGRTVHIHAPTRRDRRLLAADREGILQAAGIVAVSHHTAREVRRELDVDDDRVQVVYPGIDHDLFQPAAAPRPLEERYVLFVGSEHPRKNLTGLLQAFSELKRRRRTGEQLRLVKIGAPGGREAPYRAQTLRTVTRLGLEGEVIFTGRVADEDLPVWYTHAECLVLASYAEGFGLPPLEAMACGCPVIVSRAGALPEVAGPAALTVEADDTREIANALEAVLRRADLRDALRRRGPLHAARFTWRRAAERTLNAHRRFLHTGAPS